jgi:hypothetical protein
MPITEIVLTAAEFQTCIDTLVVSQFDLQPIDIVS